MLVALTSVLVVGIPLIVEALSDKSARLIITFQSSRNGNLTLLAHNAGDATAVVDGRVFLKIPRLAEYEELLARVAEIFDQDFDLDKMTLDQFYGGDPIAFLHLDRIPLVLKSADENGEVVQSQATKQLRLQPNSMSLNFSIRFDNVDMTLSADDTGNPNYSTRIGHQPCRILLETLDAFGNEALHEIALECQAVSSLFKVMPDVFHVSCSKVQDRWRLEDYLALPADHPCSITAINKPMPRLDDDLDIF